MLLAIDTSTSVAGVAIFGDELLSEHARHSGKNHTTQLMSRIQVALAESGITPEDLSAIGVALGPGSFNGLRVGLATAKLLSLSLNIPLVGASTLEATAYQHREAAEWIRPVLDAGRGQVATALYWAPAGVLSEVEAPALADLRELALRDGRRTLYCGEIQPSWVEVILNTGNPMLSVARGAAALRRPGYLAELAKLRLDAGQVADLATLQPIYLRRPPVLEKHEPATSR
jgi:tRNA threonylcarbamoyladenosine biosynthesis protein TsaB